MKLKYLGLTLLLFGMEALGTDKPENILPVSGSGNGGDAVKWADNNGESIFALDLFEVGIHDAPAFEKAFFNDQRFRRYRDYFQEQLGGEIINHQRFSADFLDSLTLKALELSHLNRAYAMLMLAAVQEFTVHSSPAPLNPIDDEYLGHDIPRERLIQAAGRRLDRISLDPKLFFTGLPAEQMIASNQPSLLTHEWHYILNIPRARTETVEKLEKGSRVIRQETVTLQDSVEARNLNALQYQRLPIKTKKRLMNRKLRDFGYASSLGGKVDIGWREEGWDEAGRPYVQARGLNFEGRYATYIPHEEGTPNTYSLGDADGYFYDPKPDSRQMRSYCENLQADFENHKSSPVVDRVGDYNPKGYLVRVYAYRVRLSPEKKEYIDRRGNREFWLSARNQGSFQKLESFDVKEIFTPKTEKIDLLRCEVRVEKIWAKYSKEHISEYDLVLPAGVE